MLWFHSGVLAANALAVSKVFAVIVAANTFALGVGAVYCMLIVLLTSDMAEIAMYATTACVVDVSYCYGSYNAAKLREKKVNTLLATISKYS